MSFSPLGATFGELSLSYPLVYVLRDGVTSETHVLQKQLRRILSNSTGKPTFIQILQPPHMRIGTYYVLVCSYTYTDKLWILHVFLYTASMFALFCSRVKGPSQVPLDVDKYFELDFPGIPQLFLVEF